MSQASAKPKIYHITHIDNIASIVAQGKLCSDAVRIRESLANTNVGMNEIKTRRMKREVHCHPKSKVGEYVPFYFCPRSVMLYLLHQGNHPGLTYRGGQGPILTLEADLYKVIQWANANGHAWAFSTSNAGAAYTQFYNDLEQLDRIKWEAVRATDWRDTIIKESKQAEFLLFESFPWELVERIGVQESTMRQRVAMLLEGAAHKPSVETLPRWYY